MANPVDILQNQLNQMAAQIARGEQIKDPLSSIQAQMQASAQKAADQNFSTTEIVLLSVAGAAAVGLIGFASWRAVQESKSGSMDCMVGTLGGSSMLGAVQAARGGGQTKLASTVHRLLSSTPVTRAVPIFDMIWRRHGPDDFELEYADPDGAAAGAVGKRGSLTWASTFVGGDFEDLVRVGG